MAIDTLLRLYLSMTTMTVRNTLMIMAVLLAVILLAASTAAAKLPTEPVAISEVGSAGHQKGKAPGTTSNAELYKNMVLAEQELGESYDDDYNDNDDNNVKDNKDTSLLSMMTSRSNGSVPESNDHLLMCISCTGVLPLGYDERDPHANEQSYCLPDRPTSQKKYYNEENERDKEKSICFGASRCWKAKVREVDGRIRISRGCVSGGQSSNSNRYSGHNGAAQLLHPCLGALHIETVSKNSKNSQQPPYTVWTSSHTYSSASADQSLTPPPRYVIECCAGLDKCNDGPFPPLPSMDLLIEDDNIQLAWWHWSPISMAALLLVVVVVATFTIVVVLLFKNDSKSRKKKRRKRNKSNSSRRRNIKRKRSHHHEDGYSDDSDKKKRRHLSFSSMSSSSSSSSLSSISSSSCCEGKMGKKKRRRKQHVTALTMVDLLKGVVVTNDSTTNNDNDSHRRSYTEYSPAALTESTIDDDFLPPPYMRRNEDHQNNRPEDDWTSGSGYGMPVLVQRTLAKQIQLRQLVGKGRYGEVWRATYWNGGHEHVAVKIFLSKDEPSWKRETEIYSTVLMRHDNILGFIGSDIMTSRNSYTTQLLLITHYHRHGSLYDFLQTTDITCNGFNTGAVDIACGLPQQNDRDRPPLTVIQMLNVLYTIVSGLCHLHTEIHGTQGKPGIAHRDVKSKNVLVKCAQTGTCCVADFGMAVTSRDATLPSQTTIAAGAGNNQNTRVGTKRYMAPEVLDDSISSAAALALASAPTPASTTPATANSASAYWCFDAYRRGDVYSYALVIWEVLSRTLIPSGGADGSGDMSRRPPDDKSQQQPPDVNGYNPYMYRAPYQDRGVGWDPSFDDMRNIVCSNDPVLSRPGVATEWQADPIVNTVVATMRECWHANPNARLPTLRVKKTLAKLLNQCTTAETEQWQNSKQLTTTTEQL